MRVLLLLAPLLLLAGCNPANDPLLVQTGAPPPPVPHYASLSSVSKACDEGRAVYVYESGWGAGIAIVENAAECAS
jgi:hypothetical protein